MINQLNDYLIFEGNNKKILDSLKEPYCDKVKLIYLDPPYNTKRKRGARKGYNDTFTRSNWDDEIYSVIEKSYELLSKDGFLAASINQTELFNFKNLLDKKFNHSGNCFIGLFPVKIRHKDRQLMINASMHDVYEYLLVYNKTPFTKLESTYKAPELKHYFNNIKILDNNPTVEERAGKKIEIYESNQYTVEKTLVNKDNFRKYLICGKIATANWSGEFYENHLKLLGSNKLIKVHGLENHANGYRWFETDNGIRKSGAYYQSFKAGGRPKLPHNDINLTDIASETYKEGGEGIDYKDSKKPEFLMNKIIEMTTKKNDLILDCYGGSGTTMAVAIKKNRNCILIENQKAAIEIIKLRLNNLKQGKDDNGKIYKFDYFLK